mgnify:FL=1
MIESVVLVKRKKGGTILEKERQAKELYKRLSETFAISSPPTNISINEPGLQWNCTIEHNDHQCAIYCFGEKGYAISFLTNFVSKARGRTGLENELISSVASWLANRNLNELLDTFEFIDPGKRYLEKFQENLIKAFPEIERYANLKFEPGLTETFCLMITASNRHCHIRFYDNSKTPTCEFYWEDFYVFKFSLDNMFESVLILKRWFCDNVMPSVLAKEFPFLDKGELSELSNFSKVIESDFIRSWDNVDHFYREIYSYNKEEISGRLRFISQLRAKGYERTLRAGTSFLALVLSRSMRHGLRDGQPRIIFQFGDDSKINIYTSEKAPLNEKIKICSQGFHITPDIESLLKQLILEVID